MKTGYVIENGTITNVIVVNDDTDLSLFKAVVFPETYPDLQIGYTYVDGVVRDQQGNIIEPIDQTLLDIKKANDEIQAKLKKINSIGFLEWEDLGAEKQAAVRTYKQALLDLPNQPGFPYNIQWPEDPLAPKPLEPALP
jgi:hypothetical protein